MLHTQSGLSHLREQFILNFTDHITTHFSVAATHNMATKTDQPDQIFPTFAFFFFFFFLYIYLFFCSHTLSCLEDRFPVVNAKMPTEHAH